MERSKITLFFFLLSVLPGCSPTIYEAPEKPLVSAVISEQPDPDAKAKRVQTLKPVASPAPALTEDEQKGTPLSLHDTVRLALAGNRDIQVASFFPPLAREDLKSAEAVYDPTLFERANVLGIARPTQGFLDNGLTSRGTFEEHRWDLQLGLKQALPTGGGVALYFESNRLNSSSTLVIPNPQNTSKMTAEIKQPILKELGDRTNRSTITVANLNIAISNEQFRQKVVDAVRNVVGKYWQIYYYQSILATERDSVARAEELRQREEIRKKKGISKQLDVDRVDARVNTLRSSVLQAYNQVFSATVLLKLALGMTEEAMKIGDTIITSDRPIEERFFHMPDVLLDESMRNRPEIAIALKSMEIAEERKNLASHGMLPRFDVKATYSYNGLGDTFSEANDQTFFSNDNSWSIGVELEYPLGNHKASAEFRKGLLEYEQARTNLSMVREQIEQEVSLVAAEVELASREMQLAKEAMDANARILKSENVRYDLAQVTNEELLRTMELYAASEKNYARSLVNYNIKLMDLNKVRGILLDEFDIVLEAMNDI